MDNICLGLVSQYALQSEQAMVNVRSYQKYHLEESCFVVMIDHQRTGSLRVRLRQLIESYRSPNLAMSLKEAVEFRSDMSTDEKRPSLSSCIGTRIQAAC